MEKKGSHMPDGCPTWPCEFIWSFVKKFNTPFFNQSSGGLPDANGNIIPWSELAKSRSGCEVNQKLGRELACSCPEHNQIFLLKNKNTGENLANIYYNMMNKIGFAFDGETDENGITQIIHAKHEEEVEIIIFAKKGKMIPNGIRAKNGQIPIKRLKAKTTVKTDNNPITVEVEMPKIMKLSDAGFEMLKSKEGKYMKNGQHILYNDQAGHATIGYGYLVHLGKVGTNEEAERPYKDGIDEKVAINILKNKISEFEEVVNDAVTESMEQNEFDAFALLAYNIGPKFRQSGAATKFNNGDKIGAAMGFRDWNKVRDKHNNLVISQGLVNRREEEKCLFENGTYSK